MPSNLGATQILTLIEGREAARRTNAFETLCYRRILKVSGINKITNKEIFDRLMYIYYTFFLTHPIYRFSRKTHSLAVSRICSEDRQFQERVGELAGWLKDRGYEESLFNEQIDRVRRLDRTTLLAKAGNRTNTQREGGKGTTCCDIPSSTQ